MTIIICALGALLGLVVALVCGKLVLPTVLAKQESQTGAGTILGMPVGQVTILIYRFVMPFVFAVVGAFGAYQVFVGGLR